MEIDYEAYERALNDERLGMPIYVTMDLAIDWDPTRHPRDLFGEFAEVADTQTGADLSPTSFDPQEVDAQTFHDAFQGAVAKDPGYLSEYTVDEFRSMRCFLSNDGRTGGAIKKTDDGHFEAVSLYNNGGPKGAGVEMLRHLMTLGVDRLDCVGPILKGIYEKEGFTVYNSDLWDERYANPKWDPEIEGRLPIYYMKR